VNPDISEFSYGYALTETLISAAPSPIRAAPVFPSLLDEGKPGGGYDVHLPFTGFPLFLQFKLSHRMVRDTAMEVKRGFMTIPFYRIHLRPMKHSQQHPMLLTLESSGAAVYYAAPYFHTPTELNDAYTRRVVVQRSFFIKPSLIGPLPNQDEHHISFGRGLPTYLCSDDPRVLREEERGEEEFRDDLVSGFYKHDRLEPNQQSVEQWADRLERIVLDRSFEIGWVDTEKLSTLRDRNPLARFTYLARAFFGCNVLLIAPPAVHEQSHEA
jgi:hypothetical protein